MYILILKLVFKSELIKFMNEIDDLIAFSFNNQSLLLYTKNKLFPFKQKNIILNSTIHLGNSNSSNTNQFKENSYINILLMVLVLCGYLNDLYK